MSKSMAYLVKCGFRSGALIACFGSKADVNDKPALCPFYPQKRTLAGAKSVLRTQRTPKRILTAHLTEQSAQLHVDRRPPSPHPRFPAPVTAKARPMPAHYCIRPTDCHGL
jgi:hypothetical protein